MFQSEGKSSKGKAIINPGAWAGPGLGLKAKARPMGVKVGAGNNAKFLPIDCHIWDLFCLHLYWPGMRWRLKIWRKERRGSGKDWGKSGTDYFPSDGRDIYELIICRPCPQTNRKPLSFFHMAATSVTAQGLQHRLHSPNKKHRHKKPSLRNSGSQLWSSKDRLLFSYLWL